MFSNGVYWYLVFSFLPNVALLSILFSTVVIIVTTFAGYIIFFRKRTKAQIEELKYGKLLIRNLINAISSQYIAIIICLLLGALTGGAGLEAIGSLEPLRGYDLLVNHIAGILIIIISVVFTFIGNYFIAFKKALVNKKSRLFVCLFFAVTNGGILLPISMYLQYMGLQ